MYATILTALDGSEPSLTGGRIALELARRLGAEVLACHVYAARLHADRLRAMEPGLPDEYQDEQKLAHLRGIHDSLIAEGLQALSRGYLEAFLSEAAEAGVPVEEVHLEGRNYARILDLARERGVDLIAVGAHGLGDVGDGLLGSTAARVLRGASCDVLVARRAPQTRGLIVGIDGGDRAEAALRRACVWGRTLQGPLRLAAAYDPRLHVQVFQTMARSLSPERQAEVGLDKQEDLHRTLIDEGLATLYRGFLERAAKLAESLGSPSESVVLKGKPYRALADHERESPADLIAVARFGHHHEEGDPIGSNAEAVARTAATNVLVVTPPARAKAPAGTGPEAELQWEPEALARLERIPPFARPMAKRGIEQWVRERGGSVVTLEAVREVGRTLGMGGEEEGGG